MGLKEQLAADLKEAMRSGDATRRMVIRGLMAAINEAEQRNREELVKKALQKHGVLRPAEETPEAMAAYEKAVQRVMQAENVEAESALSDPDVLGIVQKLVKQRQDSIAEAERAGRTDIVQAEQAELVILENYLPKQLSRSEIEAEVRQMIAETGASGLRDMGRVMAPLMEKLKGRADGKVVSEIVREQLS